MAYANSQTDNWQAVYRNGSRYLWRTTQYMAVNKLMLWTYGLFNKTVMGTVEMYYQYNHDYDFNSDKFERAFNFKPTAYSDGIKLMSETLYKTV